jgi:hypothetical protein
MMIRRYRSQAKTGSVAETVNGAIRNDDAARATRAEGMGENRREC